MRTKTLLGADKGCFVVETGSLMCGALFYVVGREESLGSTFSSYQLGASA